MSPRIYILSALLFTACGTRNAEQAREKERIELEERAQREAAAANKAITEMNRKMFSKRPASKASEAPVDKSQGPSKQAPK